MTQFKILQTQMLFQHKVYNFQQKQAKTLLKAKIEDAENGAINYTKASCFDIRKKKGSVKETKQVRFREKEKQFTLLESEGS